MKRGDLDRCQKVLGGALEENKQMRREKAEMLTLARIALRKYQREQDEEVLVRALESIVNLSKESE